MEYESDSDCVSILDSQSLGGDLYTLKDINGFLEETFGQSVKVTDYFPDPEKFLKSAITLQKIFGLDILGERKLFHVTVLRKMLKKATGKGCRMGRIQKDNMDNDEDEFLFSSQ